MKECVKEIVENASEGSPHFPSWLQNRKKEAADALGNIELPSVKDERWKYTNLSRLQKIRFRQSLKEDGKLLSKNDLGNLRTNLSCENQVVFVNGIIRQDLGNISAESPGLVIKRFCETMEKDSSLLDDALKNGDCRRFVTLNNAAFDDGLFIQVDNGFLEEITLLLQFVGAANSPVVRAPRIVIAAKKNAKLTLIEQFSSYGKDSGLTNAVSQIFAAEGAQVQYYRIQEEAQTATHIANISAHLEKGAEFHCNSVVFGGDLTRIDIDVDLKGKKANCHLNGLYVGNNTQHIDHHTTVNHIVGDTHSTEFYRGILGDGSRGVFNGRVVVDKKAQKITASQVNNNLLLSSKAEIDTKPELEIYADDVACSHGATIGHLDDEQMFYLRSRGIRSEKAKAMLISAFAQEVVARIPNRKIQEMTTNLLKDYDLSQEVGK